MEDYRALKQQLRQNMAVLNRKAEQSKIMFIVSVCVCVVFFIIAAALSLVWSLIPPIIVFFVVGLPGLIGWRRAERKLAASRKKIHELEGEQP